LVSAEVGTAHERRDLFVYRGRCKQSRASSLSSSARCTVGQVQQFSAQSGVTMGDFHASLINCSSSSSSSSVARTAEVDVCRRRRSAGLHSFSIDAIIGNTSPSADNMKYIQTAGYLNHGN